MTLHQLILRYAAFAVLAALANLGVQRAALAVSPWLLVAMVAGTLAGLVVKYVLDKHWIFFDTAKGAAAHGRQFLLYSTMGVATTLIAWGAETGAWALWGTDLAREAGTALGLMVGYVVKFRLDRAFVFTDARLKIGRTA